MASPQKENGYTIIANELVDILSQTEFSPNENKIFWAILRKTYGWKKKEDVISLSQFQVATKLHRKCVCRSLKSLEKRNIIIVTKTGTTKPSVYQIQKNYELWDMSSSDVIATSTSDDTATSTSGVCSPQLVAPHAESLVAPLPPTKDNKDNNKRENFEISFLEIQNLKNLGWKNQRIKEHFLMREFPEAQIDEAMGKKF